ncbi:hypothetical protein GGI25_000405 [Coemansia spiralis]|uniref:Vacuolar ATPase assembly protein VMA22 n=2 Tax=Coemansia TaxID=4863 RepID=A0A9W8KZG7_9FUNG|nr:hypothetical protein BX070DRAFT_102752 [Coemansia spiralis]KAJ1996342.1 hypothetical protein EDC05_000232 [Coemansia umbellata]KAJ2624194.1 hypothetical protein GGI26_001770 [Coemansia sp. RSA 1358]KAJ2680770.1 hypothetical protein GGI25_000405 [Coemansia spiralis]
MSEHRTDRQNIDDFMLELFDNIAEYRSIREESSAALRQAFFDLALAKRSAGYRWISPDLYSANAQAIATVAVCENSCEVVGGIYRRDIREIAGPDGSSSDCSDDAVDSEKDALSKRCSNSQKSKAKKKCKASDNPLLWFGMLVPPKLKEAQGGFAASLDHFIRLAQLKRSMQLKQDAIKQSLEAVDA